MNAKLSPPKSHNLVFTSAGDRGHVSHWLLGERQFDVFVAYYGDGQHSYRNNVEHYFERKGGKFPNLHFAYSNWPTVFAHYDAIMVMDDDILIDAAAINNLFAIRAQYSLKVLQPAFRLNGKISHRITAFRPFSKLRFVNFVENTCPLFFRPCLDEFMKHYDPALVGYGTDWWYLEVLHAEVVGNAAIVDQWPCINPFDDRKQGRGREIDALQSLAQRERAWYEVAQRFGLTQHLREQRVFRTVPWLGPRAFVSAYRNAVIDGFIHYYRRFLGKGTSPEARS